jgi:predicted TIM-barrel fold metal-dependent hydrolase
MKKIDMFAHICPQEFIDALTKIGGISYDKISGGANKFAGRVLWDVKNRLEIMDKYDDYVQVLVPVGDVIEPFFNPKDTAYLIQVFNDAIAEIIQKYPTRLVAGVASLPLNNIAASLTEIDRSVKELGLKGINLHTPVYLYEDGRPFEAGLNQETVKPLDSPEFMPIYQKMAEYDLPIWIHPFGLGGVPAYAGEKKGKYWLHHILGWPIESAMVMGRLVCSGVLTKYPNLKFIIHHCGSGIIPPLASRFDDEIDLFTRANALNWEELGIEYPFKTRKPTDYLRKFYADTALNGYTPGLISGYDFFGAEHIIFGTDFPFDMASGDVLIRKTIDSIYRMNIPETHKTLIFEGNAKNILKLNIL